MAHFAELDENNIVLRVVVINNEDTFDKNGDESEAVGRSFCESLFGGGRWVQTSYNKNFRKQFAGIGSIYDSINDVFICPQPASWFVLNENHDWICPEGLDPSTGLPWTNDELLLNELAARVQTGFVFNLEEVQ